MVLAMASQMWLKTDKFGAVLNKTLQIAFVKGAVSRLEPKWHPRLPIVWPFRGARVSAETR